MSISKFQCRNCGKQVNSSSFPGTSSCPKGGNHIWEKVGRFVKRFFLFGE